MNKKLNFFIIASILFCTSASAMNNGTSAAAGVADDETLHKALFRIKRRDTDPCVPLPEFVKNLWCRVHISHDSTLLSAIINNYEEAQLFDDTRIDAKERKRIQGLFIWVQTHLLAHSEEIPLTPDQLGELDTQIAFFQD